MLTKERCQEIFDKVFKFSDADETEASFSGGSSALTRFANNEIHQNVAEEGYNLSVRVVYGKKTARASTNKYDDESIKKILEEARQIAQLSPDYPDLLPMLGPQKYKEKKNFFESTDGYTPEQRARQVGKVFAACEKEKLTAAGYFSTDSGAGAQGNSKGLIAFDRSTGAGFSTTVTGPDSTGWVIDSSPDVNALKVEQKAARAIEKTLKSKNPQTVPAGKYTIILEPAAVTDLLVFLIFGFSAKQVAEKQSYLTDRVGKKVFGDNITIVDDVYHPLQSGQVYDAEGVPKKRMVLVENGVVKNLCYDRLTAQKEGKEPTGHGFPVPNTFGAAPGNIVVSGGKTTLEEMIASTEKGILVTRFWYNRLMEPMQVVVTGMTRDGTFYIENGKIKYGIKNMRYDESVVEMLNKAAVLGPAELASGVESPPMIVPPMKVEDFTFQSATLF